jgi:4-hydroxybenzoate polyprenyltransferase
VTLLRDWNCGLISVGDLMDIEQEKRKQAKSRLKSQQAFKAMLGGFVILWVICWAIWLLSGGIDSGGIPWPLWVMFGTGIAAIYTGYAAYGPRSQGVSDAAIDREVKRMDE